MTTEYRINPWVASRTYAGETIIYNLKEHSVMQVSDTASTIWEALKMRNSFVSLVSEISRLFQLPQEKIQPDIEEFIESLRARNVVQLYNQKSETRAQKQSRLNAQTGRNKLEDLEKEIAIEMSKKKQLYNVMFEITYRCNQKCAHCYAISCKGNESKEEISTRKIKELINVLYEMNAFVLTFSGGEPFMRKDFLEIFEYARKKDFVCNIFTNAILITDDMIEEIANLYPRSIQVSIYSARPELHDGITQLKGSWNKMISTLEKLHNKEILLGIKSPPMKSTVKYCSGMKQLAKHFDASLQMDLMITAKNDGDLEPLELRVENEEEIKKVISDPEIDGYYKEYKRDEKIRDKDPEGIICGAGTEGFCINPYGVVNICTALQYPIGDVNKQSIRNIWNHSQALKDFRKLKWEDVRDCKGCPIDKYCIFCPGTALSETGDMLKKVPYACKIAKIRAQYFETLRVNRAKKEVIER